MSMNVIFCFSGSGNCLDIAKNIAKELGDTDIIMMRKAPVKTDVTDALCVGFVFPCYAAGLPGHVEEYIRQIKISPAAYTFGIVSAAAYPGTGLGKINSIIPLDYWRLITHQCSCIWLFPHNVMVPPSADVFSAQKRSEKLAKEAANDIRERVYTKKSIPGASICDAMPDTSGVYSTIAAKMKVERVRCVTCGQCVNICPQGNIHIIDKRVIIGTKCIQCLSCLQYCPKQAISMGSTVDKRERYHNPNVTAQDLMKDLIHID